MKKDKSSLLKLALEEILADVMDTVQGTPERAERREQNLINTARGKGAVVDPIGGVEVDPDGNPIPKMPEANNSASVAVARTP